MGRNKQSPKKKQSSQNWNFYEYTPVCKRRKVKSNNSLAQKFFVITHSDERNKQYYLGTIKVGTTDNTFPEQYDLCKICFNICEDEAGSQSLILNCDNSYVIVHSVVDIYFLKGIKISWKN